MGLKEIYVNYDPGETLLVMVANSRQEGRAYV